MIERVKGMADFRPPASARKRRLERLFLEIARQYGFGEILTPVVEPADLFHRSIGEATDIVEKEMYVLPDRHGKFLALRPEGTAGVVRSYIEHRATQTETIARWAYSGPMYRYERPQKGRSRQFHQLGAEVFGLSAPEQDAELIQMAVRFLTEAGIPDFTLEINSLGDSSDRAGYRATLVSFLESARAGLCPDCQRRLETNPLRVLDCKQPACSDLTREAPLMLDHLGPESRRHFDRVTSGLTRLGVPFTVNKRIVRGLDYYNRTAFEFKVGRLGAQDAVGGGGRYDGLVASLGGPDTPAVGFAMGVERLMLLTEETPDPDPGLAFFLVPMGEAAMDRGIEIASRLRKQGLTGEIDFSGRRLKHLFARAEALGVRHVLILGEDELSAGQIQVRSMADKAQVKIPLDDLGSFILK